jgi:chemotaxis methyl-accepting protein methylase
MYFNLRWLKLGKSVDGSLNRRLFDVFGKAWDLIMGIRRRLAIEYLRVAGKIWKHTPRRFRSVQYGNHLHSLVLRVSDRKQDGCTFFLRNRAELELIGRLALKAEQNSTIDVAVFACSKGAEVYSIAWTLKSARPDLTVRIQAVDVLPDAVKFAEQGCYSLRNCDEWGAPFDRIYLEEMNELFDRSGEVLSVKQWIREGISWHCADAGDPVFVSSLGSQDMVFANRFLCHMGPACAERVLRNVSRILKPGGHLFASGVDLDVRTKVATDRKWKPITELAEDIHEGDPSIRDTWPLTYWSKEPFQATRTDAAVRYASAFQR